MLEGSDLLIEEKGYLFLSIFIFRGGAAHTVRTLLGGCYLKSVQGGGRGFKIVEFRANVLFEWPLISYVLSDQVLWWNIKRFFELLQKLHLQIYADQFMTS